MNECANCMMPKPAEDLIYSVDGGPLICLECFTWELEYDEMTDLELEELHAQPNPWLE